MKIKIIIYHGLKGSGKTTQLATHFPCDIENSRHIVGLRPIIKTDTGTQMYYDDCDLKKDLVNIPTTGIDWLWISTEKLPKNYRKLIWNYFGEDVYDVRECMFPYCNYIYKVTNTFVADMGAISFTDTSRKKLIAEISRPQKTIYISIPDIDSMRVFLESNKVAPSNFREWGLDYSHLMKFYEKFNNMTNNNITVTDDEACAIANYTDIDWIFDLFFNLFNDYDDDLPF